MTSPTRPTPWTAAATRRRANTSSKRARRPSCDPWSRFGTAPGETEGFRGARVGDGKPDPAGTAGGRAGLGVGGRDGLQARGEPGLGLAPDGEAAGPGIRLRGAPGARLPPLE